MPRGSFSRPSPPAREPLERDRLGAAPAGPGRWQAGHGTNCREPRWEAFVLLPGASLSGFQGIKGSLGEGEALLRWEKRPTFPGEGSGWCPVLLWDRLDSALELLVMGKRIKNPAKYKNKEKEEPSGAENREKGGGGDVTVQ